MRTKKLHQDVWYLVPRVGECSSWLTEAGPQASCNETLTGEGHGPHRGPGPIWTLREDGDGPWLWNTPSDMHEDIVLCSATGRAFLPNHSATVSLIHFLQKQEPTGIGLKRFFLQQE